MEKILVANSLSNKGEKIVRFLRNLDFLVVGVDKWEEKEKNGASSFFRVNLKHPDSVKLVYTLTQPTTIVYPWIPIQDGLLYPDYSSIEFFNLVTIGVKRGVKKVILCLDINLTAETSVEMQQLLLHSMIYDFAAKLGIEFLVVTSNDNLLKSIKRFLKGGKNESDDKSRSS